MECYNSCHQPVEQIYAEMKQELTNQYGLFDVGNNTMQISINNTISYVKVVKGYRSIYIVMTATTAPYFTTRSSQMLQIISSFSPR
jgi:hypothetical protein